MEELEQALREKGLLDGRDIKDIVAEVDADNVINKLPIDPLFLCNVARPA